MADIIGYSHEEVMETHLVSTFIAPSLQKSVQDMIDSTLQGNEMSNTLTDLISVWEIF